MTQQEAIDKAIKSERLSLAQETRLVLKSWGVQWVEEIVGEIFGRIIRDESQCSS